MSLPLLDTYFHHDSKINFVSYPRHPAALPPTPPPEEDLTFVGVEKSTKFLPSVPVRADFSPVVAVMGVGYVGAHLVEAFGAVYQVLAYDVSDKRLADVASRFQGLSVRRTSHAPELGTADAFLIAVPTVLNADKTIDTTYLESAVAAIEQHARPGTTVIVESSVAVGMTRQLLGPLAQRKGLKIGMSPERVDPGRVSPAFETIPKIISGIDGESLDAIHELYGRVFSDIVTVSTPEVAEMTKLYENCQRMVCAAYANEMADACAELGIDAWEVSRAAASKPFGFLPFQPGAGIGGHCIPVNPHYLFTTCSMPLLQQATEASRRRPSNVARRLMEEVTSKTAPRSAPLSKAAERPRILVVGAAFKRGQCVTSNAPGIAVIVALLSEWECYVEFADPLVAAGQLHYVPKMDTDNHWTKAYLEAFDGIVVAVDQEGLDLDLLNGLEGPVVHNYCPRR